MITTPAHTVCWVRVSARVCTPARVGVREKQGGYARAHTYTRTPAQRALHTRSGNAFFLSFTHAISSLAAGGYSQIEPGVGLS